MNRYDLKQNIVFYFLPLVVFSALAQWAFFQSQQSVNPDNAYLTHAAMRLLSGERMSQGFYDVNPPLSFLVYLPAAFLIHIGIPLYYAIFGYSCVLVTLSSLALFFILKSVSTFSSAEKRVTLCLFLLAATIATMNFFGERDHYIALAITPLFFLQLAITNKDNVPSFLKWSILVIAGIFIFLKPHYGLIPAIMFLHRAVKQKRFSVIVDCDFIALIIAALMHVGILCVFFPDFINIILPDAVAMYAVLPESFVNKAAFEYGFSLCLMILISCLFFNKPYRNAIACFIISTACLAIFYMMQKGFLYQLIPFMVFFSIGLGLLLNKILSEFIFKRLSPDFAILVVFLFFIAGYYAALSPKHAFLTHEQYKNNLLTKMITECGGKNCSFFMFNDRIDMIHELSVYSGQPLASRFPTFFFLPFILDANPSSLPADIRPAFVGKYTNMVADDFEKYKPAILLIGRFALEENKEYFDFPVYFKEKNGRFNDIFSHYIHTGTTEIDQNAYTGGIFISTKKVVFDIYKRKD